MDSCTGKGLEGSEAAKPPAHFHRPAFLQIQRCSGHVSPCLIKQCRPAPIRAFDSEIVSGDRPAGGIAAPGSTQRPPVTWVMCAPWQAGLTGPPKKPDHFVFSFGETGPRPTTTRQYRFLGFLGPNSPTQSTLSSLFVSPSPCHRPLEMICSCSGEHRVA